MGRYIQKDYDLICIGSGAGGGVAAHIAAKAGKKVAIIESNAIGGECPNYACIPTKALLTAAHTFDELKQAQQFGIKATGLKVNYAGLQNWKNLTVKRTGVSKGEEVYSNDGIDLIRGRAHFLDKHTLSIGKKRISAKNFIIATGSHQAIPEIKGLQDTGFIAFYQATDLRNIPKSIFIIGAGAVGCEFAQIFSTFGAEVHIAEHSPHLLSREDNEAGILLEEIFADRKIQVHTSSDIIKVEKDRQRKVVHFKQGNKTHKAVVEEIMIATGKHPNTDIGLENAGIEYGKRGIKTNTFMQTSQKHIYAVGDVTGPYGFTHMASYQSRVAAHNILHRKRIVAKYHAVPRVVFTDPEVASVGLTEAELRLKKVKYRTSQADISIIGRANTSNKRKGFVKVIVDENSKLVGATIVAPRAGEMIHELTLAINLRLKPEDIESTIHAFPTWSEAIRIACAKLS